MTCIAGIYGNSSITSGALGVVINSDGELGVVGSSERCKTPVAPMGARTAKLDELHPVTFQLKGDARRVPQYGLIAEEVAKVYLELVVHGPNGRIDGVRYDELAPMLLDVVQKQASQIRQLQQQVKGVDAMRGQLAHLQAALSALDKNGSDSQR